MAEVPQQRLLRTSIPGPLSTALHERKTAAVSSGVGVTLPVYVARPAAASLSMLTAIS